MIDTNILSANFDRLSFSALGFVAFCLSKIPGKITYEDLIRSKAEKSLFGPIRELYNFRFLSFCHYPGEPIGEQRTINIYEYSIEDKDITDLPEPIIIITQVPKRISLDIAS